MQNNPMINPASSASASISEDQGKRNEESAKLEREKKQIETTINQMKAFVQQKEAEKKAMEAALATCNANIKVPATPDLQEKAALDDIQNKIKDLDKTITDANTDITTYETETSNSDARLTALTNFNQRKEPSSYETEKDMAAFAAILLLAGPAALVPVMLIVAGSVVSVLAKKVLFPLLKFLGEKTKNGASSLWDKTRWGDSDTKAAELVEKLVSKHGLDFYDLDNLPEKNTGISQLKRSDDPTMQQVGEFLSDYRKNTKKDSKHGLGVIFKDAEGKTKVGKKLNELSAADYTKAKAQFDKVDLATERVEMVDALATNGVASNAVFAKAAAGKVSPKDLIDMASKCSDNTAKGFLVNTALDTGKDEALQNVFNAPGIDAAGLLSSLNATAAATARAAPAAAAPAAPQTAAVLVAATQAAAQAGTPAAQAAAADAVTAAQAAVAAAAQATPARIAEANAQTALANAHIAIAAQAAGTPPTPSQTSALAAAQAAVVAAKAAVAPGATPATITAQTAVANALTDLATKQAALAVVRANHMGLVAGATPPAQLVNAQNLVNSAQADIVAAQQAVAAATTAAALSLCPRAAALRGLLTSLQTPAALTPQKIVAAAKSLDQNDIRALKKEYRGNAVAVAELDKIADVQDKNATLDKAVNELNAAIAVVDAAFLNASGPQTPAITDLQNKQHSVVQAQAALLTLLPAAGQMPAQASVQAALDQAKVSQAVAQAKQATADLTAATAAFNTAPGATAQALQTLQAAQQTAAQARTDLTAAHTAAGAGPHPALTVLQTAQEQAAVAQVNQATAALTAATIALTTAAPGATAQAQALQAAQHAATQASAALTTAYATAAGGAPAATTQALQALQVAQRAAQAAAAQAAPAQQGVRFGGNSILGQTLRRARKGGPRNKSSGQNRSPTGNGQ